jgi:hypothetical protein
MDFADKVNKRRKATFAIRFFVQLLILQYSPNIATAFEAVTIFNLL